MSATVVPKVVLILGAGANIGSHVARVFAENGYKVALAARKVQSETSTPNQLFVQGDFSDPTSVVGVFAKVKEVFGNPSVVVYNAAAVHPTPAETPLAVSLADFTKDLSINTTSLFVAAQQAVEAFEHLPATASRTFIYTGNKLNEGPIIPLLTLGVGKSASAHIIDSASKAYKEKGYKFYYADERKADGTPAGAGIDGPAHAKIYHELAENPEQTAWQVTFVRGEGYVKFPKDA